MAKNNSSPFYKKTWFKVIAGLVIISAIFGPKGKDQNKTETEPPKNLTATKQIEQNAEEKGTIKNTEQSPFEIAGKSVFNENVDVQVLSIPDENNEEKVTRVNITESDESIVSESVNTEIFLDKVKNYLTKIKEQNLDYEELFFIYKTKKSNDQLYPLVKIKLSKGTIDNMNLNNIDSLGIINVADEFDGPKDIKTSNTIDIQNNNIDNSNIDNDNVKELSLGIMKENFKDYCEVNAETQDNIYFIHLYPKNDLKTEIIALLADPTNETLQEGWKAMTDGLLSMSGQFDDNISENVSIMVHNPINTENVLFTTVGEVETYNFVND